MNIERDDHIIPLAYFLILGDSCHANGIFCQRHYCQFSSLPTSSMIWLIFEKILKERLHFGIYRYTVYNTCTYMWISTSILVLLHMYVYIVYCESLGPCF